MRFFKSIAITASMTLVVTSPAIAAGIGNVLHPLNIPLPKVSSSNCTRGGFPACKNILPPVLLTNDQVKMIEQWHNQNVEAAKNQLAK